MTHSHPDHIGTASLIRRQSGAHVWAHAIERAWIEDIERQERERPVPGFAKLVAGSVSLDRLLSDGDVLSFAEIEILDLDKYHEYLDRASQIVQRYGGEYVFRSEQIIPVSGN